VIQSRTGSEFVSVRRILAVAVAALAGVLQLVPIGAQAYGGIRPVLEPGACPESVPANPRIECATVTVPEDHEQDRGPVVTLQVAIVHPEAPSDKPPLLYLAGGPGESSVPGALGFVEDPIVTDRDVILLDPRGTGASLPSLACPEVDDRITLSAGARRDAARKEIVSAVAACRRRITDEGTDVSKFGFDQMAADVADVRIALGIDEWDVYGISNGGRLALEVVRRHPAGVRSLVLDAALAPQGSFFEEQWPNAERAIDELFAECEAAPACAAAHPDLENRFWALVDRLEDEPISVAVPDPVEDGKTVTVVIDGEEALFAIRGGLYDTELLPAIPSLIDGIESGALAEIVATEIANRTVTDASFFSLGVNLSSNCREEIAFLPKGFFQKQARRMPDYQAVILDDTVQEQCRVWKAGKADASFDKPVKSRLPALLLVGALDPVHPRSSSDAIAKGLANSTVVELPGLGHGTEFAHDCPRSILRAFVADPDVPVDTTCVDAMTPPQFS